MIGSHSPGFVNGADASLFAFLLFCGSVIDGFGVLVWGNWEVSGHGEFEVFMFEQISPGLVENYTYWRIEKFVELTG